MHCAMRLDNMGQLGGYPDAIARSMGIRKQDPQSRTKTFSTCTEYKPSRTGSSLVPQDLRPEINRNWRETTVYNNMNWRETAAPLKDNDTSKVNEVRYDSSASTIPIEIRHRWAWKSPTLCATASMPHVEIAKDGTNTNLIHVNNGGGPTKSFIPSHAVLGHLPPLNLENARKAVMSGMVINPNYRGALTKFHIENSSATALENCAVRVTGIHPNATIKEILQVIYTGKVYSINRCSPEPGKVPTAAADIVFVKRAAAEAFLSEGIRGVFIRGERLAVTWNRNRVREPINIFAGDSRVVRVQGPAHEVSIEMLEHLFRQYFRFELIEARWWTARYDRRVVEMTFESIHPQAAWAKRVLKQHFSESWGQDFDVYFGRDPCDPNVVSTALDRLALPWRKGAGIYNNQSSVLPQFTTTSSRGDVEKATKPMDRSWREI